MFLRAHGDALNFLWGYLWVRKTAALRKTFGISFLAVLRCPMSHSWAIIRVDLPERSNSFSKYVGRSERLAFLMRDPQPDSKLQRHFPPSFHALQMLWSTITNGNIASWSGHGLSLLRRLFQFCVPDTQRCCTSGRGMGCRELWTHKDRELHYTCGPHNENGTTFSPRWGL